MKRFLNGLMLLTMLISGCSRQQVSALENGLTKIFTCEMNSLTSDDKVTVNGTHTLTEDRNGNPNQAMTFSSNGGLKIENAPDLSKDFTLTVDFKANAETLGDLVLLISKADYSSNSLREFTLGVGKDAGGCYIILNAFDDDTGGWKPVSGYFDATQYHQAKIEYYSNHALLYVDDACYGGVSVNADRIDKGTPLLIGYGVNSKTGTSLTYQAFNGIIDDVSIYDSVEDNDEMKTKIPNSPTLRYSFERGSCVEIYDDSGNGHPGRLFPAVEKSNATLSKLSKGIIGNGLYLNGSHLLQTGYSINNRSNYTISLDFKLPEIPSAQRILFAQCNYGKDQREISTSITEKGLLVTEIRINGNWSSNRAVAEVKPNVWYNYTLVVKDNYIYNYFNGYLATIRNIAGRDYATGATLSFGGTMNNENGTSFLKCYIDEIVCYNRALDENEVKQLIPEEIEISEKKTVNIISDNFYKEAMTLNGIKFVSIQMSDYYGYKWQHGVSMTYFNNKFYATWGRNKGAENTVGEESVVYESDDALNWQYLSHLTPEEGHSYSHGVIFPHNEKLILLTPFFEGNSSLSPTGTRFVNIRMHGYEVNGNNLVKLDIDIPDFWPLQQPERMKNGNYIIGGIDEYWRAAVAISDGEDFTSWRVIKLPYRDCGWTETNILVEDDKVIAGIRKENPYNDKDTRLGYSCSEDYGETWSMIQESDMRFSNSKPCLGKISDGTEFLIGNSIMGAISSRRTLTISLGENGIFNDLCIIRKSDVPAELRSTYAGKIEGQSMSYPSTFEKDGKLYVCYSSEMYGGNNNNIELAIIDLKCLYQYRTANEFISDHINSTAEEVINDFLQLDEYAQGVLLRKNYLGAFKHELDLLDLETAQNVVDTATTEMLNIIDAVTPSNKENSQNEVRTIFNSLSNKQIALIEKQAYLKIRIFIL